MPDQFVYYGESFAVHSRTMFSNAENDKREVIVAARADGSIHGFIYADEHGGAGLEYYGDFEDIDSAYPEMRDWLTAGEGGYSRKY
jgi:hypothetical protein